MMDVVTEERCEIYAGSKCRHLAALRRTNTNPHPNRNPNPNPNPNTNTNTNTNPNPNPNAHLAAPQAEDRGALRADGILRRPGALTRIILTMATRAMGMRGWRSATTRRLYYKRPYVQSYLYFRSRGASEVPAAP